MTLKAQMAGGKATAIILRKQSLEKYYSDPAICQQCLEIIQVPENQQACQVKKKKFCDSSCSASYTNARRERRKKGIKEPTQRVYFDWVSDMTKGEIKSRYKNYQSYRSAIVRKARKNFLAHSKGELKCQVCGYSNHVEVAHIKAVSSFPDTDKISYINRIENLIGLCPNHHWEYDSGLLKL